jgi:hypothetical protein
MLFLILPVFEIFSRFIYRRQASLMLWVFFSDHGGAVARRDRV